MIDVPPGLTCATCRNPFARALARRTDDGYVHSRDCVSPVDLAEKPGRWVNVRGISRWVA